eukprot:CAMPEP_0202885878 /NCGR_PEP_ID=MMETSP1391-20130828/41882_1 /ASSEMBLY_ACC=CAM_ASM_000867 /TAXON_ID=1034604 /ORGANISM="Chlamydomonas leiostraca, Strain SAG 11-49" /LENGTH=547 /DNA_ID=CAMNT_0049569135 /DNA_START=129 /DNA_END=1773 /DNA_ORIENTATION=-
MATTYVLFESASGFAVLEVKEFDEISQAAEKVQEAVSDMARFGKICKLTAFKPFASAADALVQINAISESTLTPELKTFLETNLAKSKDAKKAKYKLGVGEPKLGSEIQSTTGIPCVSNEMVGEVLRGVRAHFTRFIDGLKDAELKQAQLGLAHSYSRAKVKFNVNKVDNMIIQAIALLDTLDKDINTFVMRVREWYSWHFPELVKIVNDNYQYARVALIVQDKSTLSEEKLPEITEVLGDEAKAQEVLDAAKSSMGQDISAIDLVNVQMFTRRVIQLADYRHKLHAYLLEKMHTVAPNLSALIGETVGARLISHAGSLTNLAKYPASTVQILGAEKALFRALKTRAAGSLINLAKQPASTVQILGAEKALFRALKTKHETPKYGLIYHASLIGQSSPKFKGKISRVLAAKCALAIRVDALGDSADAAIGIDARAKVEARMRQLEGKTLADEGAKPRGKEQPGKQDKGKAAVNGAAVAAAPKAYNADADVAVPEKKKKKKAEASEDGEEEPAAKKQKKDKKDKKDKKEKKDKKDKKKKADSDDDDSS